MKIKKIVFLILETLLTIFVIIFSTQTICAGVSNSEVENLVSDFINSTFYEFESNDVIYYSVTNGITDSIKLNYVAETDFYQAPTLGRYGDIYAIPNSNVEVVPFSSSFISYYFGGHAGIILDDNKVIETSGMNEKNENKVSIMTNNLFSENRMVIGLRVNTSSKNIDDAVSYAKTLEGKKYNNTFLFLRKNRYYCTDLVSRSFKEVGVNLDNTMVYTTVSELILSKNTSISFIMVKDNNKTKIYYSK